MSEVTDEERSIACLTKRNCPRVARLTKSGDIMGGYDERVKEQENVRRLKRASLIVETGAMPQETD